MGCAIVNLKDIPCFGENGDTMNTVTVRNVEIGAGMPKICVPIVGENRESILEQARTIKTLPADLVEWRVDYLNNVSSLSLLTVLTFLSELRNELGDIPLLFTFRTKREGGEKSISPQAYEELYKAILMSGLVDLIDVELFLDRETVSRLIQTAHENGVPVIVSNHDFKKTPPKEELLDRLETMQDLGADILKIAVMPESTEDLLTLLAATEDGCRYLKQPIVSMSMGGKGVLSRVAGESFGSAITFGTAGAASAPGQLPAEELKEILEALHKE